VHSTLVNIFKNATLYIDTIKTLGHLHVPLSTQQFVGPDRKKAMNEMDAIKGNKGGGGVVNDYSLEVWT